MRLTRETGTELALEVAVFTVGAGGIALCHSSPVLLSALLIATAAIVVGFRPGSHVVALYIIGAVVGPCGEMIGVTSGAWRYAEPTRLGLPLWLPFAWGLATVLIREIAETIEKMAKAGADEATRMGRPRLEGALATGKNVSDHGKEPR